jgi:prolyl-tRNA synthetase
VRVREFTMKDAYSFDADDAGLDTSYGAMFEAYRRIFARCGVPTIPVEADSGAIGGKGSQEFIFLTEHGEDTIVFCDSCDYAANTEKAAFVRPDPVESVPLPTEPVPTPGVTTIGDLAVFLKIETRQTAKAVFFMARPKQGAPFPVFAVVRGDLEVNEVKLANALGGAELRAMVDAEVEEYGLVAGYASPIGVHEPVRVVADLSIPGAPNLVAGANEPGVHLWNVNYGRDWEAHTVADIATAQAGFSCAQCGGTLGMGRGIEMGHVFRLQYVYTDAMDVTVQGADGEPVRPTMGCYGIGVERILSAAVEANYDEQGIRWPASIAPYQVLIVGIGLDRDEAVREDADRLYEELQAAGLEVLFDDRDERPGVKFNDADLIGVPVRLTVSSRNHGAGVVEVKPRDAEEAESVARDEVVRRVQAILDELGGRLTVEQVERLARRSPAGASEDE